MNPIRTTLAILALSAPAFAQAEAHGYPQKKFAHTEQEKARIAELRKEIDSLEQGKEKAFFATPSHEQFYSLEKIIKQKQKECEAFNNLHLQTLYDSPDTTIKYYLIIHSDCKETKNFSMEDRKNKASKDSFFYDSGFWKVSERYWMKTEAGELRKVYKTICNGCGEDLSIYDEQGYAIDNLYMNGKNDTLRRERYFWENGRLARTIFDGVERVFTYGTPCDSVIVEPPDYSRMECSNPPPIYNKSFGLIPEEGDPEYEEFKREPYSNLVSTQELLERQKVRCEEYKEAQKKKGGKK